MTSSGRDCPHLPPCPGCPRFGDTTVAPDALGKLRVLADINGLDRPLTVTADGFGSRRRVRLMVRGRAASPKVGIFQTGTHKIVDIPRCGIHHPRVNEAAAALKHAIHATGAAPYADVPHRGLVRALQAVVWRADETVQTVIVTNSETPAPAAGLLDAFAAEFGPRLHSLFWNGQPERSNTILGPHWQRIHGPEAGTDRVPGATVFYPPGAFGQANPVIADKLIEQIHAWIPETANVAEFYAGVGAIGLGLLARGNRVVFNEIGEGSLKGLELGLAALPEPVSARARVVAGSASAALSVMDGADAVIVDPPRRGLDAQLRARLADHPPALLVYASCGLDSFIADTDALLMAGKLRLSALQGYGFFPFTGHVETLACFERGSA